MSSRLGLVGRFRLVQVWLACVVLCFSTACFSASPVYFAGFALAGDASESDIAFPITSRLLKDTDESGRPLLEQALWNSIESATYPHLIIERGLASGDNPGDSVAMAFVLDWENISRELIAGSTKLVVDLHAQVLIFDFDSKKAIGSYPVAVQLIHTVDGPSTPEVEETLVRQIYFGSESGGIFKRFADRLATASVRESTGNYIRVVSVELEDRARQTLAEFSQDEHVFTSRVANLFGKQLAENHGVSYVPYSKGTAIGSKMAARFANGEIYQIELPVPDYRVHLRVRGFKKVMLDSNNVQSAWAYGSYMNVAVKDYEDQKVYLDAPFKFGAVKKVVAGSRDIDDWAAFQESIYTLIDQITLQSASPDRAWVAKWSDGRPVLKQLNNLKRVIERSR